jgi:hypothetical protein
MKKTLTAMIGVLALTFTACSGGLNTAAPVIGINGADGVVTVTRTINDKTGLTNYEIQYKAAEYTFRTVPGSPGGNIVGFAVTSSKIGSNPNLIDPKKPDTREAVNIFVQSGFTCTPVPAPTQNCDNPTTRGPANGIESAKIFLTGGSELAAYMIANNTSATQVYNITFLGKDTALNDFILPVKNMQFVGIFNSK